MTTPETRHRIRHLEHRLTTPTPQPLDGQTAIRLTWQQGELPADPAPTDDEGTPWPTPVTP